MPKPNASGRTKRDDSRSYELEWQFLQRIAFEHLGSQKYSNSTTAIGELVANALDAQATRVEIDVTPNDLGGVESVTIQDNGKGISPEELAGRFVVVGVEPRNGGSAVGRFGRFGVGRLAVHRLGTMSRWVTVAETKKGKRVRSCFTLRSDDQSSLKIDEEAATGSTPLGTHIDIFNIRDSDGLTPQRVTNDLLTQFCSFLLGNRKRTIWVQGEALNVDALVERQECETIPATKAFPHRAEITHLLLKRSVDRSRFPGQVLFSAKKRTVASAQPEIPPSANYQGLVECPYLDSIVTANREGLIEMDSGFASLRQAVIGRVEAFAQRVQADRQRHFIENARHEEYYPYRNAPTDPVAGVEQAVYDVVLEKLHEHANLESLTKKQRAVVFRLLRRSLDNENLMEVLSQVVNLSDDDMEKFREVLERTTLESIIKLSSEVTGRLAFLDVLHQLVYGDVAKHVKERTQLHKIIEPQCWLFGPQFHLATSDKSFREVVRQHRLKVGLVDAADPKAVAGIRDIPDLFLAATRDFPIEPKHHHVLVELKAPAVALGRKEAEQIRRYAECIMQSQEFDKTTTRWDLFLVSAKVSPEIELDRSQTNKAHGCMWEWPNMTVWAFGWSEIITRARDEMHLVRDHLQRKSQELTVSGYLRENFPEILDSLASVTTANKGAAPDTTKSPRGKKKRGKS
jgi:hypothetical protein